MIITSKSYRNRIAIIMALLILSIAVMGGSFKPTESVERGDHVPEEARGEARIEKDNWDQPTVNALLGVVDGTTWSIDEEPIPITKVKAVVSGKNLSSPENEDEPAPTQEVVQAALKEAEKPQSTAPLERAVPIQNEIPLPAQPAERPLPDEKAQESVFVIEPATASHQSNQFQSTIEDQVLSHINAYRQKQGLSLLKSDPALQVVARARAKEMAQNEYMAHARPNGSPWHTAFSEYGVYPSLGYENIARSCGRCVTGEQLYRAWMNSPSHYQTIVNPQLNAIGIGVIYAQTSDGLSTYACTTFTSG